MRELVLQMQITVDGFVGDKDGSVEFAFPQFDDEFNAWTLDILRKASLHAMGGVTGRGLAEYWPRLDTMNERDRFFADAFNAAPKVIFSNTLESVDWTATSIVHGDLRTEMQKLKQQGDGFILVHGGARFVQSLTREHLIDEYHLLMHPVVLGQGVSLFGGLTEALPLKLVEARAFRSGAVLHDYRLA